MILITTSRRPTPPMRRLCHDLERTLPNVLRINRGKLSFSNIVERALDLDVNRLLLIDRWKGQPGRMNFFQIDTNKLPNYRLLFLLKHIKSQLEFGWKKRLSKNIAFIAPTTSSKQIVDLTLFLSHFIGIPVIYELPSRSPLKAAIHLTAMPGDELRLWFTSPPLVTETGPRIVIKKIGYPTLGDDSLWKSPFIK